MNYHLAILAHGWLDLILDGKKTIESRFTKVRCAPFGKVHEGDVVYVKESGGLVKGMFTVAKVETFEVLTQAIILQIFVTEFPQVIIELLEKFDVGIPISYRPPYEWQVSNYATLIHILNPVRFETPFPVPKRDSRAWVVLDTPLHKCDECGDRYLLEVYESPDGGLVHGSEHLCPPCYARECVSPDEESALAEPESVI